MKFDRVLCLMSAPAFGFLLLGMLALDQLHRPDVKVVFTFLYVAFGLFGAYLWDAPGLFGGFLFVTMILYFLTIGLFGCTLDKVESICALQTYIVGYYTGLLVFLILIPNCMEWLWRRAPRLPSIEMPRMSGTQYCTKRAVLV